MTDNTKPEALDLADWLEAVGGGPSAKRCAALLREQHARIAELEAQIEALSGVQALSAAPEAIAKLRHLYQNMVNGAVRDTASAKRIAEGLLAPAIEALERATPPAEQAAPKAAPGVGNSGFDHKTAADFLNGKTVRDEAMRTFVAASRWAHDERAALSATLLAMHGVLTSREAEIALLKKALLEAEAAPQQEAQEPCGWTTGITWRLDTRLQSEQVIKITRDTQPKYGYTTPIYTAPQPAPAPLSEREAFEAWIKKDGGDLGTFGTPPNMHYRNSAVNNAWVAWQARAALAAQGGK